MNKKCRSAPESDFESLSVLWTIKIFTSFMARKQQSDVPLAHEPPTNRMPSAKSHSNEIASRVPRRQGEAFHTDLGSSNIRRSGPPMLPEFHSAPPARFDYPASIPANLPPGKPQPACPWHWLQSHLSPTPRAANYEAIDAL